MTERVAIVGDNQIPFQDEKLHEQTCRFLAAYKPDRLVILGDFLDFPGLSRFARDPAVPVATVQECVDVGKRVMADYRSAVGKRTPITYMEGNHEKRLGLRILGSEKLVDLFGLVTVPGLLDLSSFGVEWMGNYPHDKLPLAPKLAVMHGWIIRQGSGASALATLQYLHHSIVIGHTHRLGMAYLTQHEIVGGPTLYVGAENGTQCDISKLGYTVAPNWQNGLTLVDLHDNGLFYIDQAVFASESLLWRGNRF